MPKKKQMKKLPVLISYAMLRKLDEEQLETLLTNPSLDILVDSGAFTVHTRGHVIDIEEYGDFLLEWGEHLWGAFTLDVIGDPVETWKNHKQLLEWGCEPIPIFTPGMKCKDIDRMFESSSIVGIGGIQNKIWKRGTPALLQYLKKVNEWADGRNIHLLGVTKQEILRAFKPFSCDASNWTMGWRFGVLNIYLGNGRWEIVESDRLSGRSQKRVGVLSRETLNKLIKPLAVAGYVVEDLFNNDNWTYRTGYQHIAMPVASFSWIQYIREFYERFGVKIFLVINPLNVSTDILLKCLEAFTSKEESSPATGLFK